MVSTFNLFVELDKLILLITGVLNPIAIIYQVCDPDSISVQTPSDCIVDEYRSFFFLTCSSLHVLIIQPHSEY